MPKIKVRTKDQKIFKKNSKFFEKFETNVCMIFGSLFCRPRFISYFLGPVKRKFHLRIPEPFLGVVRWLTQGCQLHQTGAAAH